MKIYAQNRTRISKEELVKALPMGRWFGFEAVSLDMTKESFNRRVRNLPEMFVERTSDNRFKIKDDCLSALLATCKIKAKMTKAKKAKKAKVFDAVQDKEQKLFDLFMNA